ncbi:f-box only protein [Anaeramoeba flamelloides]|uniref:F-box only protein n=1 Tax=Anaeramoeba flamelloides TaxID=1746091 RepID=A0AAV7YSW5_9EUKA|nr:f-box only protein [Anaeramoeba flamelloides]
MDYRTFNSFKYTLLLHPLRHQRVTQPHLAKNHVGKKDPFSTLPDEVILEIFGYLDHPIHLGLCSCVGLRFNRIADDYSLWYNILHKYSDYLDFKSLRLNTYTLYDYYQLDKLGLDQEITKVIQFREFIKKKILFSQLAAPPQSFFSKTPTILKFKNSNNFQIDNKLLEKLLSQLKFQIIKPDQHFDQIIEQEKEKEKEKEKIIKKHKLIIKEIVRLKKKNLIPFQPNPNTKTNLNENFTSNMTGIGNNNTNNNSVNQSQTNSNEQNNPNQQSTPTPNHNQNQNQNQNIIRNMQLKLKDDPFFVFVHKEPKRFFTQQVNEYFKLDILRKDKLQEKKKRERYEQFFDIIFNRYTFTICFFLCFVFCPLLISLKLDLVIDLSWIYIISPLIATTFSLFLGVVLHTIFLPTSTGRDNDENDDRLFMVALSLFIFCFLGFIISIALKLDQILVINYSNFLLLPAILLVVVFLAGAKTAFEHFTNPYYESELWVLLLLLFHILTLFFTYCLIISNTEEKFVILNFAFKYNINNNLKYQFLPIWIDSIIGVLTFSWLILRICLGRFNQYNEKEKKTIIIVNFLVILSFGLSSVLIYSKLLGRFHFGFITTSIPTIFVCSFITVFFLVFKPRVYGW